MNAYDFTAKDNTGAERSLSEYRGKVLLIVNTATKCGLTPQYEGLEALYKQYRDKGLEILDFPCNQFLEQAPGTDEEIQSFCSLSYGTTFPRFAKVDVNGPGTHPLFAWLKEQAADTENESAAALKQAIAGLTPYTGERDIKWNFCKFLIGRDGAVAARYYPSCPAEQIAPDLEKLL